MIVTKLYMRVPKGTPFKPGSLVGESAIRADYITLANGDAIGVLHALSAAARTACETAGAIVLPPLHRPLKQTHLDAFEEFGAAPGDTGYDVAEKLFALHQMPWMHPENGPQY